MKDGQVSDILCCFWERMNVFQISFPSVYRMDVLK